jgi:hypothetical protein
MTGEGVMLGVLAVVLTLRGVCLSWVEGGTASAAIPVSSTAKGSNKKKGGREKIRGRADLCF